MHRTWFLTDLEFIVLRDRLLNRYLPWPFSYVGPVRSRIEFLNETARTWRRLQANWDPDLADAITRAGNPDAKVRIMSWDSSDLLDPSGRYFMAGSRCGSRAVLVQGIYEHSTQSCDRYRIVECDAHELSSVIVDILPEMPAGSQERIELTNSGETADGWSRRRSNLYDQGDDGINERSRQWQSAPRTTVGMIEVRQGRSKFGPEGMRPKQLFWEDHPDDGRYLIDLDPPISAVGVDSDNLRQRIDRGIAEMLRMVQDESREGIARTSVFEG